MSYILEALKKAERERAQGQSATTADGATPAPGAPGNRAWLLKALIVVLMVNAIVFAAILLRPGNTPVASEPAAQGLPPPNAASFAPQPIAKPAPPTLAPPSRDEPVVEQGVASMDDLGASSDSDDVARPIAQTEAPAQMPRGRVTFSSKPLTEITAAPDENVEEAVIEEPEPPAEEEESGIAPASEATIPTPAPGPAPSATPRPGPDYKHLGEMSAAYQATFPQFKMEVHVHDAQPQRRFVLIEGKRYREGDTLPQGARLSQIVAEGIVVEFRNEKVLFPIGRH
jgi:general secretion pathway protein B